MTRSWLLFVSVSVACAAFLASVRGLWSPLGLSNEIAAFSLILGAGVSGFVSLKRIRKWVHELWQRMDFYGRGAFFIFVFAGSLSFLFLFSEVRGVWGTSNPDNLGDLPYHLQLIHFFARGAHFPPIDPTFAGENLHYPYAIDLWDALWVKLGVPAPTMLVATGLISLFIAAATLWRTGGLLLLAAFFLSGGLALSFHWSQTFGPESVYPWKNLFYAIFVTQRGFLWALPAGLYVIRKWTRFLEEPDFVLSKSFLWIWGILPFFHLHSFVVISFWMGLTILAYRRFTWRLAPAAALALFFILRSITTGNVQSALGWNWGWMFTGIQSVLMNLGPWLMIPIFLIGSWIKQKRFAALATALTLTFFAVNSRTAPWPWDQIKILIWVYLLWTFWAVREFQWKGTPAAIFAILFLWPGVFQWVSGLPSMTGRFEMQNGADRAMLAQLFESIPAIETVAADVDHRHPLLGLGQSLVLGYPGHAWSHGYPVKTRTEGLEKILQARPGGDAFAKEIGVKWLVWKDNSISDNEAAKTTWSSWGWKEEKRIGAWHLWKVESPTNPQ